MCLTGVAAFLAFSHPYSFATDDAVSYLDLADEYRAGHWRSALNAYWSPLYSVILASADWLTSPRPTQDVVLLRSVNFLGFLLAAVAFALFGRMLGRVRPPQTTEPGEAVGLPGWAWPLLGTLLFCQATLRWIGLRTDTPDLLAAALVLGAAALAARSHVRPWRIGSGVALGVMLGFAYLARTALFGVSVIFLLCAAAGIRDRRERIGVAAAVLSFCLVVAPLVTALSMRVGRLTIGESGKVTYALIVNPTRRVIRPDYWQGGPAGFGSPRHAARVVNVDPEVLEFAGPVGGTYAPWTDPSYWYDGLTLRVDWRNQLQVVETNLEYYASLFLGFLLVVLTLVWCVGGLGISATALIRHHWRFLVPAIGGLGMYLVVTDLRVTDIPTQPSSRMVAPFAVLVLAATAAGLRVRGEIGRRALARASGLAAVAVAIVLGRGLAAQWAGIAQQQPVPAKVARSLQELGVVPGDWVAILGRRYDVDHDHEYWARMARVRIVSHVPCDLDASGQMLTPTPDLQQVLANTGARVLVCKRRPGTEAAPGWTPLQDTDHYAWLLPPSSLLRRSPPGRVLPDGRCQASPCPASPTADASQGTARLDSSAPPEQHATRREAFMESSIAVSCGGGGAILPPVRFPRFPWSRLCTERRRQVASPAAWSAERAAAARRGPVYRAQLRPRTSDCEREGTCQ